MTTAAEDGFTLVEMLITLAIVGVVFGLFSAVIGFGRDVVTRTAVDGAHLDEIALTRRMLIETLSQVVLVEKVGFAGEPQGFVAVAYAPRALGLTGPTETTVTPDKEGRGLQFRWMTEQGKSVTRRLLSTSNTVNFSYFRTGVGWVSTWEPAGVAPSLVRVRVGRGSDPATGFDISLQQLGSPSCLAAPASRCLVTK